jgi:hypothetical protein
VARAFRDRSPLSRIGLSVALAAAFFASSIAPTFAAGGVTGTLRGSVVDSASASPIVGATVNVTSGSGHFRGTTDAHGFFVILDLPPDTYTAKFSADGYEEITLTGVTVFGDQVQSVGVVKLVKGLKTIANVQARNAGSAFQPHQTIDVTTFQGQRVDQALGEKGSTNMNQLVLSAPGVIKNTQFQPGPGNSSNAFTIRGSASVEIGYQFDGVDYRGSFFDENPSQAYLNGVGGGKGGLQVVSGAGDATQGGIGAGVVNVVPGRGSYPGSGFLSFDVGSPWYDHSMAGQYGYATPDDRFSDFFSFRSTRAAPQIAPYGRNAADAGQYLGTSFTYDDDVLNNFYYRFGKNNNQQIQVLTDWLDHRSWANYGGLANVNYYPYDPFAYTQFQTDFSGLPMWPNTPNDPTGLGWYQSVIPYLTHVPTTQQPPIQPLQYVFGPTNFLKIGYTRPLGTATSLNTFFYNWGGLVANNITGESSNITLGAGPSTAGSGYNNAGGRRVGFQAQATTVASEKHTLTLVGRYENGFPYWNQQIHGNTWQGFLGGRGMDQAPGLPAGYSPTGARVEDWYLPLTPGLPVDNNPADASFNPCTGPALDNGYTPNAPTSQGCYLYNWLLANGKWTGKLPTIPTTGFDYNNADFQQWGIGLRDQWTPNSRLVVDYGLRVDGQNLKWAGILALNKDLSNTADIGTGYAQLSHSYLYPKIFEPRIALSYVLTSNDSVRFSYGRSASFFFAQTAGTPTNMTNVDPILWQIPAKDKSFPTFNPATGQGPACGSGWHVPGQGLNGAYVPNPNVVFSGAGTLGVPGNYFQCANYAQSVYWAFDQAFAAPDIGGQNVATYNNWDIAYSHQFKNGWGAKLTGYARRGYNTYQTVLLAGGLPDPVTGQQTAGSFQVRETGVTKTAGVELFVTTPDRPIGWSGFLTVNYVNALTATPPIAGSADLGIAPQYLYETGALFHAAYLSPLSAVTGIQYRTRSGFKVNPIFTFDNGIPYSVGLTSYGFINGTLYAMPTGNIGVSTPFAGPNLPNQSYNSTCYDDPAFAGSYLHPKYFACRGNNEPALAGQAYSQPRLYADLDLEWTSHRGITFGMYITNLFNNYRAEPTVNTAWQPVATGVGGAQSGQFAGAYPSVIGSNGTLVPNPFYLVGARNLSVFDQYWLPFQHLYVPGQTWRFYMQLPLGKGAL